MERRERPRPTRWQLWLGQGVHHGPGSRRAIRGAGEGWLPSDRSGESLRKLGTGQGRTSNPARRHPVRRRPCRHPRGSACPLDGRPAGYHPRTECQRRHPSRDRTADQNFHPGRQGVPRYAARLLRVRDEPALRAANGGHRQGEGPGRLQGTEGFDERRGGPNAVCRGRPTERRRASARHRPDERPAGQPANAGRRNKQDNAGNPIGGRDCPVWVGPDHVAR